MVLHTFKHLRFLEVAVERDIKLTLRSVAFIHLTGRQAGRHPGLGPEGAKEHGTVHAMYCCPCLSANLVTDLAVGEFSNFSGQMFLLRSSNCHSEQESHLPTLQNIRTKHKFQNSLPVPRSWAALYNSRWHGVLSDTDTVLIVSIRRGQRGWNSYHTRLTPSRE